MAENSFRLASIFVLAAATALAACSPAGLHEETVAEAPAAPIYISTKQVSTDCGVNYTADPPPGWAGRPGTTATNMPPPLASRQAVGFERPIAETDFERVSSGIVVIEPGYAQPALLINNEKETVGEFENDYFSFTQLLDDGSRLASSNMYSEEFDDGGGNRGCLEEYGPDGELNWRLRLSTDNYIHHHDAYKLPNGNVLAVVWERVPTALAIALGRNPEHVAENGSFWFDGIIEVNPATAEIVWEWSMRNHLVQDFDPGKLNYGVVADNPGKLDINAINFNNDGSVGPDWTHVNAFDYNEELDQIIFSSNYLWEVYVIDHGTTPYEAQGPAGDFLYRWGNAQNYDHGDADDTQLFAQHDVHWIDEGLPGAGNLMIFNNGSAPERPYTTVVEISPEMNEDGSYVLGEDGAYGPTELTWEYVPKEGEEFFSWFISGAQRLPNGNTLVNHGARATVREVTTEGDIVWEYEYADRNEPPHMLFRAYKYAEDHPGIVAITGAGGS